MQIRELDLKELYSVYDLLVQLRPELSYKEFEDLIYDMRHIEYKMYGIIDGEELISYAGINIQTNFYHKRHLYIFDLITDDKNSRKKYDKMMLEFLDDLARIGMCENIVLSKKSCLENSSVLEKDNGFYNFSEVYEKKINI